MPQVGDRSVFAIEWRETNRDETPLVYGHFCLWAAGERIGHFEDETQLTMTAEYLRTFLSYAEERHLTFLDGTSKEEIYEYVYELGHGGSVPDEIIQEAQQRFEREHPANFRDIWAFLSRLRSVFYLDEVDYNVFDHLTVLLLFDGSFGMQRLIWCDWWREHQLYEVRLPDHVFEEVASAFLATADIPARPTTLFDLFHQAGGGPIELDGQQVYRRYQRQVRGWTHVQVRREQARASPVQGVRIKSGKVNLAFNGDYVRDLILWANETPETLSFQVIGQQGAMLKIWNVWRSEQGDALEQNRGNAGILAEDKGASIRLRCSDGVGPPDFQDLVVEIAFHPGKPAQS